MVYNNQLVGERVYLRSLTEEDCTPTYLSWLHDDEVNQYLESRNTHQNEDSMCKFVRDMRMSPDDYFFGIFLQAGDKHIGNIRIGPIHPVYKHAYLGYMLGDKQQWGAGLMGEAIDLVMQFCFGMLGLHKLNAGVLAPNVPSQRTLERAGFAKEGCFRKEVLLDGSYVDSLRYGLLASEYERSRQNND